MSVGTEIEKEDTSMSTELETSAGNVSGDKVKDENGALDTPNGQNQGELKQEDANNDNDDDNNNIAESEAETERLDPSELHRDDNNMESDSATGAKKRKHEDDVRKIKKRRIEGIAAAAGKSDTNLSEARHEEEDDDDEEDAEQKIKEKQRKDAIALLTEIEVDFAKLRDSLHEDKMARYIAEIEMCADGTHPELAKVALQIENIRDDKVRLARNLYDYQRRCIDVQTKATREQLHQQCFKDRAEARSKMLLKTTEEWYRVNRERRSMDTLVPEYTYRVPDSRGDQIRQRQAVNDKVSVLAGITKHVGFPAAPEVTSMSEEEMYYDLHALGLR